MKNKYILLLLLLIFSIHCRRGVSTETDPREGSRIVAKIGNEHITLAEVDALIEPQLTELRRRTLESMMSEGLLRKEAESRGIGLEDLVDREIYQKAEPVTGAEIEQFKNGEGLKYFSPEALQDDLFVKEQLIFMHRKQRQFQYVDSLMDRYDADIFLTGKTNAEQDISRLEGVYSRGNRKAAIEVYIIFDFDCPSCQSKKDIFSAFYDKYQSDLYFHYVFYGSSGEYKNLVCEAAGLQGNYWDVYEILINNEGPVDKNQLRKVIASLNLDMEQFDRDLKSPEIISKVNDNNKVLAELNIYSVPSVIINGQLIQQIVSLSQLEEIVERTLGNF